ncbi:MAG: response regulator transcription factor [Cytophagales bacterium]|nr:response regulator transcription factor [Cytophagales bacterium]
MNMPVRICIVEDNPAVREGYKLMLDSNPQLHVAGAYGSGEEALKHIESVKPDVILMDIELPGINGIESIKRIKRILAKVHILVITVHEDSEMVFEALCAGATGYLTKTNVYARLIDSIQEILSGGAPMSTNIARMIVHSFHKNNISPLTDRETEVLQLLSQGKTYSMIAESLFIDKETVKTHIKNIYIKLEVHSKDQAIEKAKKDKLI